MTRHVAWFSCGAASAVMSKLVSEEFEDDAYEVVYCDTLSTEHPDNARFFDDVERWIGKPIRKIKSDRFESIDDVFMRTRFMSGVSGARCTAEMKKAPRIKFEDEYDVNHFGYTAEEYQRARRFEDANPGTPVEWLLIQRNITKPMCLARLKDAGIALPAMYALGFEHNNCLGCVKATSAGYWNRTRKLFPEVFARRVRQSRELGVRLARLNGERVFLDELPPDAGAPDDDIDCGPSCQLELFK